MYLKEFSLTLDSDISAITMTNSSKDLNHFLLYKSAPIDLIGPFCSPIILEISSLSCYIVLKTYLKKLNKIMKGLLQALAIHNFISSLICILELIFMILLETQSFEACSILIQSWIPVLTISLDSLAVLSFMRYHIASKTAKTEVVDKSRMFKIVALVMLGEHAINAIWNIASIYYQMPFLSLNCAGKSMEGPMLYQGFIILKTLVVMIIGVVFDVLLAKFLEKRTVFPTLPPLNAKNVQNVIVRSILKHLF